MTSLIGLLLAVQVIWSLAFQSKLDGCVHPIVVQAAQDV